MRRGFPGDNILSVVLPSIIDESEMLRTIVGMDQRDSYANNEACTNKEIVVSGIMKRSEKVAVCFEAGRAS